MSLHVAVIGCGAAGLVALRHLAAKPHIFTPIAFERTSDIGGTWVYNEGTGTDEHGQPIHSSMYKNLRTNLPKEVMAFPDFPFSSSLPSFVAHLDVRNYLEDYAEHFHLRKYIKTLTAVHKVRSHKKHQCSLYNTVIDDVFPVKNNEKKQWKVSYSHLPKQDGDTNNSVCVDAVMVCNGHYSDPIIPDVPGLKNFPGKVMHSHDYRHPESFQDLNVLCLGAGASGQDLALDIAKHAKQVYLGHRKARLQAPLPSNMSQVSGIGSVNGDMITLEDGHQIQADALVFCTGYKYTFPFLSPECSVNVDDERVTPLYKHCIHTSHTNMCFIGLPKVIVPFPQFDCQVRFFLAALEGSMSLPSQQDMEEDTNKDYQWRKSQDMPQRHCHHMGSLQWGYNDSLMSLAGLTPIPPVVRNIYDSCHEARRCNLLGYRNAEYTIIDESNYQLES